MVADTLKYFSEQNTPLTGYFFEFASFILGVKIIRQEMLSRDTDIYYGNNDVNAKLIIKEKAGDIIWDELIKGKVSVSNHDSIINFDIVNAVVTLLTDKVNQNLSPDSYDSHQRLKYEYSFQAQNGIGGIPAVNIYMNFFKGLLKKYTSYKENPLYPENKKCAIGLSHDVDKPLRYQILRGYHFNSNWSLKEKNFHFLRYIHNKRKYLFDADKTWMSDFSKIMEIEKNFGFVSTFFFASNNGYSDWGSVNDVFYEITWDEFQKVFGEIRKNGFQIGLHASYQAYTSPERFEYEKEKLERISGAAVNGVRHHYWHTGSNTERTFSFHEKAGFGYDSSIGFNDHPGFRRNTALPFYPFDSENNRIIKCMQLPVFCMDGNLFYSGMAVDKALSKLKDYIAVLKLTGGTGMLNWHSETSFPQEGKLKNWAEAYIKILEYLAEEDGIWITSPDEIFTHFMEREKVIKTSINQ